MEESELIEKITLTPKVDETQEFIEIANDFSNPLDVVELLHLSGQ